MANPFYLICVVYIGYSEAFMDPCTFYPKGFIPVNETEVVTPTPSCTKGIIDWNYPRGTLDIQFNQQSQFKLCIKDWLGGDAFTIFDNSFDKMTDLQTLTDENQCISSHGHKAVLIVKAPPEQRYMGGFEYEIIASKG